MSDTIGTRDDQIMGAHKIKYSPRTILTLYIQVIKEARNLKIF